MAQLFKTKSSLHHWLCYNAKSCACSYCFYNSGKSINTIVPNGKRFIAYDLVKRLQQQNSSLILNDLSSNLNNTEIKEGKLHNVFETSFDWKECKTEKFIQQKLDYIHLNHVKEIS